MNIGIIGSMQHSEAMVKVADELRALGHEPSLSPFVESMLGKTAEEQERLKIQQKNDQDAMRKDIDRLATADVILMLNLEKNGQPNYIGGNAFLEMGMAYLQGKPIFLYNPIPDNPYYRTEIEAFKPTVINGNLSLIK